MPDALVSAPKEDPHVVHRLPRFALASLAVLAALLVAPATALGHTVQHAGPYTLEIGWRIEPTYVAVPNAVSVTITDAAGKPVNDLGADDLHVVVTTANTPSPDLSFEPGFDPEELEGPLGEYDAAIVPTAPGDFTFHITGSIHGQKVDVTVSSGDETFDPVKESTNLQFPTKLPSVAEVATRLDRIDSRVTELQAGSGGPSQAAVDAAMTAATDAKTAADRALIIGIVIGGLGLVVGGIALLRARRAVPVRPVA
jgi:hypothetical protein